jgi:Protein of unknown function (DUF2865)
LAGLIGAVLAVPSHEASAQGLFDTLFGFSPRSARSSISAPAYAPSQRQGGWFGFPDSQSQTERPAGVGHAGGASAYCVRMCDGKYFPLPRAASTGQVAPAKVCSALCPMAPTKVFNGSDPTRSVASDGTRYDDLDNALAYRERVVPNCSCTGNGPGGLAQIDVESDPTLRAGDVVATSQGLRTFRGSGSFPYKTADFTPVGSYERVSADLRQKLSDIRVDETARPAPLVQTLAGGNEGKAEPARPRRPRAQAVITPGARQNGLWGDFFR